MYSYGAFPFDKSYGKGHTVLWRDAKAHVDMVRTQIPRQRLDLNWFAIRRDGSKTLLEEFEIGDTVFPVNTVIESSFDIDSSARADHRTLKRIEAFPS